MFSIRRSNSANYVGYIDAKMEVESDQVDPELWSQALVNAKGDEAERKNEYIKLRAAQIQKEQTRHA